MDELTKLLQKIAWQEPLPEPEPNFFNITGRGYLENPTSDLMALFMGKKGPSWLAKALLRCLVENNSASPKLLDTNWQKITVEREIRVNDLNTDSPKRLDLLIASQEWVIAVENKVFHTATQNPFHVYETLTTQYPGKLFLKCVIRPTFIRSDIPDNWTVITYQQLVNKAHEFYGKDIGRSRLTKWEPFYREFLSHLEDLANPRKTLTMNERDFNTAIDNFKGLTRAQEMLTQFKTELEQKAKDALYTAFTEAGIELTVTVRREDWDEGSAIVLKPLNWKDYCGVALLYPTAEESLRPDFRISVYKYMTEAQNELQNVADFHQFSHSQMCHWVLEQDSDAAIMSHGDDEYFQVFVLPEKRGDLESACTTLASVAVWFHQHADVAKG